MVPPPHGTATLKAELIGQALLVLDGHDKERLSQALKLAGWDGREELRLIFLAAMAVHGGEDVCASDVDAQRGRT